MRENKFIGGSAFGLFIAAAALMVLLVFSGIQAKYALVMIIAQPAIVASGVLALAATVLGFVAFKTAQGKVGAMGGLVLVLAMAVLLSFITITRVERSSVPLPQPIVQPAEP